METWRIVTDYDNYMVSDHGNVKSIARVELMYWFGNKPRYYKEKKIVSSKKDGLYSVVSLCKKNKVKQFYLHRLIAETFIRKLERGNVINHKDGNIDNNCLENLEIISQRENCLHGLNGRKKSSKYPGVHFYKQSKKYKAMARHNGKKKYLGSFDNEEDAYDAYKKFLNSIGNFKYL